MDEFKMLFKFRNKLIHFCTVIFIIFSFMFVNHSCSAKFLLVIQFLIHSILIFNIIHITVYAQYSTLMLLTVVRYIVNLQREGGARPFAPAEYLSDCLSLFRNPAKMWQQFQYWCSKTNSIMGNSLEENPEYFLASHSRILWQS